jgi:hypothetical protein
VGDRRRNECQEIPGWSLITRGASWDSFPRQWLRRPSLAAAFVAGVVLAVCLTVGVVASGLAGLVFGAESGEAAPKPLKTAFARVLVNKNANNEFFEKSRGVVDVLAFESGATRVYCFDLSFVPKVAAGSAHFNNNATVAVWHRVRVRRPLAARVPTRTRPRGPWQGTPRTQWPMSTSTSSSTASIGSSFDPECGALTRLALPARNAGGQHSDQGEEHRDSDVRLEELCGLPAKLGHVRPCCEFSQPYRAAGQTLCRHSSASSCD